MEILWLDSCESTQLELIDKITKKEVLPPVALITACQKSGVGSRGNRWIGIDGNLFLSFAVSKNDLPADLPLHSASIYFSYILKEILAKKGSKIWLKWPNDFFVGNKKAGGCVTNIVGEVLICGIGLNIVAAPRGYGKLDIVAEPFELGCRFLEEVEKKISWKQIFSKYKLEFHLSKSFVFNHEGETKDLKDAELSEDGSVIINGKRIYSLR